MFGRSSLVYHGTSAYTTEYGDGLYSIEYIWNTLPSDFPAKVLGGRPYPGIVQHGQNVPYEDGLWVTCKLDMAWKMAIRAVQQRLWTPAGNAKTLKELEKQRSRRISEAERADLERRIHVLRAREAHYRSLTGEQLALLHQPIVTCWEMDDADLIHFLEKSKRGTMVVKSGYLLWRNLHAVEFPRSTPNAVVSRVYRNIKASGATPKVKMVVGTDIVACR